MKDLNTVVKFTAKRTKVEYPINMVRQEPTRYKKKQHGTSMGRTQLKLKQNGHLAYS